MVLEIAAARLIAPYLGVSLYTWTSIIGVVLAGLSLGNWLGGIWADRGAGNSAVGLVLVLSGIATLAILLLLTWVAPAILANSTNLLSSSLLMVGSLFFIPAFLMGIVMPVLMTMALSLDSHIGHVVGKLEALAALGSILGTFAAGFWLIQFFGTRILLVTNAVILFLLAVPYFWSGQLKLKVSLVVVTLLVTGLTYWRGGFLNPCNRESQYYCIRVVNLPDQVTYGKAKGMILDYLLHSINFRESPVVLISPYVHLMDELISHHYSDQRDRLRYFFAGGGAYTHPRAIQALWPEAKIDVAELDPVVTEVAESELWFKRDGINIYHQDARLTLTQQPSNYYDVIIGDVFHDITVPYHLITREYLALVKSRLKSNGIYMMNLVDGYPDPRLLKSVYRTLKSEFREVHIYLEKIPDQATRHTYVIIAGDIFQPLPMIKPELSVTRKWYNITSQILDNGTPINKLPLLTDDFSPVDRLLHKVLLKIE
jgi:spermidine synthase